MNLCSVEKMKINSKKKLFAIGIVAVFSLSNIGLPVVITACPMMKTNEAAMSCCPVMENQPGTTLKPPFSMSCCAKTLVTAALKFESAELKTTSHMQLKFKVAFNLSPLDSLPAKSSPQSSSSDPLGGTLFPGVETYLFISSLRI